MLREICQAGEMALRQPSRPLTPEEIVSPPMQDLIASMFETMRARRLELVWRHRRSVFLCNWL